MPSKPMDKDAAPKSLEDPKAESARIREEVAKLDAEHAAERDRQDTEAGHPPGADATSDTIQGSNAPVPTAEAAERGLQQIDAVDQVGGTDDPGKDTAGADAEATAQAGPARKRGE